MDIPHLLQRRSVEMTAKIESLRCDPREKESIRKSLFMLQLCSEKDNLKRMRRQFQSQRKYFQKISLVKDYYPKGTKNIWLSTTEKPRVKYDRISKTLHQRKHNDIRWEWSYITNSVIKILDTESTKCWQGLVAKETPLLPVGI